MYQKVALGPPAGTWYRILLKSSLKKFHVLKGERTAALLYVYRYGLGLGTKIG